MTPVVLPLALAVAAAASAQPLPKPVPRVPRPSLGVAIGSVKATDVNASLFFVADLRFHLGHHVAIAPEVGYWKQSETVLSVTASLEDLNFGVNVLGLLPLGRTQIFAGIGGGVHQVTGQVGFSGQIGAKSTATEPGLSVLGGFELSASDGLGLFLIGRYDWLEVERDDERGPLNQGKIYGGLRFRF